MVKKLFLVVIFGFSIASAIGQQDILRSGNLMSLRVDLLSEADIRKVQQQLTTNNLTIEQVRPLLISKGLNAVEYDKLKSRLQLLSVSPNKAKGGYRFNQKEEQLRKKREQQLILPPKKNKDILDEEELETEDSLNTLLRLEKPKPLIDPRIFGSELFNPGQDEFDYRSIETDLTNLATPLDYEIGPGDQLKLVVYGKQEYNADLDVSREGNILVAGVGQIKVGGLTIEAATTRIKQSMRLTYPTLLNGTSKLTISLGETRTIKVTVVGANRSGSINIPSLSSIYDALSKAGGPTNNGSFRQIELVRNNRIINKVDLYRLLSKGDQSDNWSLRDNDVMRIPSYQTRVELSGQVKRPGLYEVLPGESFADILQLAGGFDDTAYTAAVKLIRKGQKERVIKDLVETEYTKLTPSTGDLFVVSKILDRYANRVKVTGAVFRPDQYEWISGMKVSDLIQKADGIREDAYTERAILIRQRPDLTREMKSFDLRKALSFDPAHNVALQKEDEILVSSTIEMTDSLKVTLLGEVHLPGDYHFIPGMTLKSLILHAGGFTDASSANIQVAHLIIRDTIAAGDSRSSEIESMICKDTLAFSDLDIPLRAYDVVTVRKKPVYNKLETVLVVGQVQFPGPYVLTNTKERVSDLYKRVGGILPDANLEAAYIKRFKPEEERKRIAEDARRLQLLFADSSATVIKDIEKEFDKIPLSMSSILRNPGSTEDVILQSRDELIIPKFDAQVRVSGAVLQSTQIPFEKGSGFNYYVAAAGGYSREAWKKSAYIIYANGKSATTKRFLFFKNFPRVEPGAEIIVPKQPLSKGRLTTGEVVGLSSALASLAGVVIALLRL
jgi:protein involved in polysaccharide export with SLBB domain